jgi:uncharacterized membrane protein
MADQHIGGIMETRRRTLVKAVFWQVLGLSVMALVGWAVTGSAALGGTLAAINTAVGFVSYILYERLWARIGWGRRDLSGWPREGRA